MSSKIGWDLSEQSSPPPVPLGVPSSYANPPYTGSLLPPYFGAPPASFGNYFPPAYPQIPSPYGSPVFPPLYYPPFNLGEQPLQHNAIAPAPYQLHPQPLIPQPHNNDNPQPGNTFPYNQNTVDFQPSCPTSISEHHFQPGIFNKDVSQAFEENGNVPPTLFYPKLPAEVRYEEMGPTHHQWNAHPPTPVPPNLMPLWEGSHPLKMFFVQGEGHVVSPERPVKLVAYKCPPTPAASCLPARCLAGRAADASVLLKAEEVWRLGLARHRSCVVKGAQRELAFYDDSTSPARYVILVVGKEVSSAEEQRLEVLLRSCAAVAEEPTSVVDTLESGVESVFETLTMSVNSFVKKGTPDIHKNTKWLRKGTGQIVRFGGSLVSKGVHLVSDAVVEKETPKEADHRHTEIFQALTMYRTALENNEVAQVFTCLT